jgi:hypothetical protein
MTAASKRVVGKGQRHGIAQTKPRDTRRGTRAGMNKLRLRRIHPHDRGWCAPLDEHFGEGAVAAADVEPAQAWSWSKPVEERVAGQLAPRPHVSLIGSAVVEADLAGQARSIMRTDCGRHYNPAHENPDA